MRHIRLPAHPGRSNRDGGFTAIEFLVVIAIAAVLLAIGVPSFQSTLRRNGLDATADELAAALDLARSEAIRRNAVVTVATCGAGADWGGAGWIITASANVVCPPNADPGRVRAAGPLPAPMTMYATLASLAFDGAGRLVAGTAVVAAPQTFLVCTDGKTLAGQSSAVLVSSAGRVRRALTSSAGVPLGDDDQTPVGSCNAP